MKKKRASISELKLQKLEWSLHTWKASPLLSARKASKQRSLKHASTLYFTLLTACSG
jgi:hypothetical protein